MTPGCDPVVPAALTFPLVMRAPSISLIEQPLPSPTVAIAFGQPHVNSASGDVSLFSPLGQNPKPTEPSAPVSVPTPVTTASTGLPDALTAPPNVLMASDVSVALAVSVAPGGLMASDVLTVPDVPSVPAISIVSNALITPNVIPLDKLLSKNTKYVPSKTSTTPRCVSRRCFTDTHTNIPSLQQPLRPRLVCCQPGRHHNGVFGILATNKGYRRRKGICHLMVCRISH